MDLAQDRIDGDPILSTALRARHFLNERRMRLVLAQLILQVIHHLIQLSRVVKQLKICVHHFVHLKFFDLKLLHDTLHLVTLRGVHLGAELFLIDLESLSELADMLRPEIFIYFIPTYCLILVLSFKQILQVLLQAFPELYTLFWI